MKIGIVRLILTLTFVVAAGFHAKAGAPINFVGYKNQSAPIFSKAGPTTINYQLYAEYTGIHKPGVGLVTDGFIDIVVRDANGSLFYLHLFPLARNLPFSAATWIPNFNRIS
jgi:hypothetical protein